MIEYILEQYKMGMSKLHLYLEKYYLCFNPQNTKIKIVELQWFKHPWNHENMFETGVVQANKC